MDKYFYFTELANGNIEPSIRINMKKREEFKVSFVPQQTANIPAPRPEAEFLCSCGHTEVWFNVYYRTGIKLCKMCYENPLLK